VRHGACFNAGMASRAPLQFQAPPSRRGADSRRTLEPVPPALPAESVNKAARWTLLGLCVAAFVAVQPLWAPVLLAAWSAILAQPLHARLVGRIGGRSGAAGVITVVLVVVALAPLVVVGLSLFGAAVELAQKLQQSGGKRDALWALLSSEPNLALDRWDARRAIDFVRQHGAGALSAANTVVGAATALGVGLFVFIFGFYTFLVDGRRGWSWVLTHSPLPRRHMARLGDAFVETGHGLLVGVGLTAALQGLVATIGYLAIGVPQALVLGLLTTFAALIPSVGTGLVWVPVSVGLFLGGQRGAAGAVLALGLVVSVVDNFVRPALSRYAELHLPTFVLLVAMLGGIAAFGAWGLLLGPLFVRLAIEALRIWRESREPAAPGPASAR